MGLHEPYEGFKFIGNTGNLEEQNSRSTEQKHLCQSSSPRGSKCVEFAVLGVEHHCKIVPNCLKNGTEKVGLNHEMVGVVRKDILGVCQPQGKVPLPECLQKHGSFVTNTNSANQWSFLPFKSTNEEYKVEARNWHIHVQKNPHADGNTLLARLIGTFWWPIPIGPSNWEEEASRAAEFLKRRLQAGNHLPDKYWANAKHTSDCQVLVRSTRTLFEDAKAVAYDAKADCRMRQIHSTAINTVSVVVVSFVALNLMDWCNSVADPHH